MNFLGPVHEGRTEAVARCVSADCIMQYRAGLALVRVEWMSRRLLSSTHQGSGYGESHLIRRRLHATFGACGTRTVLLCLCTACMECHDILRMAPRSQ